MTNSAAQALATESLAGLEYATCSHVGLKRTINQDSFTSRLSDAADFPQHGHLFVVADGMGAHAAGELASQLAVDELRNTSGPEEHARQLEVHFRQANTIIHDRGQANPQLYNMGTTCSALWLLEQGAVVGHVGDSRVYRCRKNRIAQLTFDHSLVWEMRAAGQYSADSSSAVPRNVITRCLGPHPHVEVDVEGPFSMQAGDTFLLCSDGLTGKIMDAELGVALRYLPPIAAAEFLVDLANLRGGHDNITATVVRISDEQLQARGLVSLSSSSGLGTHPGLWLLAGLGMLLALGGVSMHSNPSAIVGSVLVAIAAIAILSQWLQRRGPKASGRLPSPPYAVASTELTDQVRQQLMAALTSQTDPEDENTLSEIDRLAAHPPDDPQASLQQIRDLAHRIRKSQA